MLGERFWCNSSSARLMVYHFVKISYSKKVKFMVLNFPKALPVDEVQLEM